MVLQKTRKKLGKPEEQEDEEHALKAAGIGNSRHSLYKEKVEQQVEVEVITVIPEHTKYTVYIGDFDEDAKGLHQLYRELREADEDDTLDLRISSNGGYVTEGAQFFNIIREKFYGNVTTYLDSHAYSMGALLFCIGDDERIIYENSELMFHDYSSAHIGKGGELIASMEFNSKHIRKFFRQIIMSGKFLTAAEFEMMINGKDFWFDAEDMCKRGIATHVMVGPKKLTAKEYLDVLSGKAILAKPKKEPKKKQQRAPMSTEAADIATVDDSLLDALKESKTLPKTRRNAKK